MLRILVMACLGLVFSAQLSFSDEGNGKSKVEKTQSVWRGFPNGTWFVVSDKLYQDKELKRSSREKRVQVGDPDKDNFTHEVYQELDGKFSEKSSGGEMYLRTASPSQIPSFRLTQTRKEALKIETKSYPCVVKEYIFEKEFVLKDFKQKRHDVVVFWHANENLIPPRDLTLSGPDLAIPADVVKMQYIRKQDDTTVYSIDLRIVSLSEKVKIGDREFVCVREEGKFKQVVGKESGPGTITKWLSNQVPGHEVKRVWNGTVDGQNFRRVKEIEELFVPEQ